MIKIYIDDTPNKSGSAKTATDVPPPPEPSDGLKALARPAWLWGMTDGEGGPRATRTGGRPIMAESETWPICGACQNPLTHLAQCDLDALPAGMGTHGQGILRLFYCLQEPCVGMGGWAAFDPQHHLSVTQSGDVRDTPQDTPDIPARHIETYTPVEDYPHYEDRADAGLATELPEDEEIYAVDGHKYGGWPGWVQGPERPTCPTCAAVMEPFVQLDNAAEPSFNFGDMGIGHISRCPEHLEIFAFAWACE